MNSPRPNPNPSPNPNPKALALALNLSPKALVHALNLPPNKVELERASLLLGALLRPPPPPAPPSPPPVAPWADLCATLFAPLPFFETYRGYVAVSLAAESAEQLRSWKGYIGSRLRKLVLLLERVEGLTVIHPLSVALAVPPSSAPAPPAPPHRLCHFIG